MNLQQIEHFLALVDTGSFSRAAERIHLTQPALSRSIQALEDELGTALFDRLGRRNALTQAGERVAAHARRIRTELSELKRSGAAIDAMEAGQLRLGLGSAPYEMLATRLLAGFLSKHPRVKLHIGAGAPGTMFEALRQRTLDAAVLHKRFLPAWDDLEVTLLPPLRLGFLCRAGHPLLAVDRPGYRHLSAYPMAASGIGLSVEAVQLLNERFGHEAHFGDLIHFQSDGIACLLELARGSDALFFGVVEAGRRFIDAGELVELTPVPALGMVSQFALVTLRGVAATSALQALRSAVFAIMKDH